jgi:uncharacterized protein (DUF305 family)
MTTTIGRRSSAGLLLAMLAGCAGHPATSAPAPAASGGTVSADISASLADSAKHPYIQADIDFMTGMIAHHAQAVLMAGWAPTHASSPGVKSLCERILVGQRDEIAWMQNWLRDRHLPVPSADASHDMMPGMEHMMMPGMLTAEQLVQLSQASGEAWDRLFLTDMIRHHQGALTMVRDLVNTPGGARDDLVFKFVSDINADQTIEIQRMNGMLTALAAGAGAP